MERILKLRNPWGNKEWKGKWNDDDKRWNEDLRKKLNHYSKNDGVFFICYEDFLKYFTDI